MRRKIVVAKIREVPIESCVEIAEGYLTPYNDSVEKCDIMARSIKELGIIQPLIVQAVGGVFGVIDGRDRWKGAEQAGLKKIWVHVVDVPNVARPVELQIMFNRNVGKVALTRGFQRICAVLTGITLPQLEPRVGMSAHEIMKRTGLKFVNAEIDRYVRQGVICLPNAYSLAKLKNEDQLGFFERAAKMVAMEFIPLVTQRLLELKPKAKSKRST